MLMDMSRMDGRLISWMALVIETLCAIVVIVSYECKGDSILIQGLQDHHIKTETSLSLLGNDIISEGIDKLSLRDGRSGISWSFLMGREKHGIPPPSQRIKRQIQQDAITVEPNPTTSSDVTADFTSGIPDVTINSGFTTEDPVYIKTDNPTTTKPPTTTTTPPTTTTTAMETTTPTTIPATTTETPTIIITTLIETTSPNDDTTTISSTTTTSSGVPDQAAHLTFFGEYGLVAFAVALGVAILLLYILLMIICVPKCLKWKKEHKLRKLKTRVENLSDMRTPGAIYRPRPSLKNCPCVPTPLAMISPDEMASVTSNKESRVVLTTDLDATADPDFDGNGSPAMDYPIDKPYSTFDRKFSTVSTTDNTNVSSFLLRQTSLSKEKDKRKQSIPGTME